MLIKVNFEKGVHEIIYITDMERMYSLQSDGDYLYFFESTQSRETKSYLIVINMEGVLKSKYEMEYDEKYLAYMEAYYKQVPDDPAAISCILSAKSII